jgi:hypothetical protein
MGGRDSVLAQQINANGFRRWYEYELARSFGFLGLGLLTLVAGLAFIEGIFEQHSPWGNIPDYAAAFASLCVTGWSWLRFTHLLLNAEAMSRQAVCPQCTRYGQLRVLEDRSAQAPGERTMQVECKKCQHHWQLFYTPDSTHALH